MSEGDLLVVLLLFVLPLFGVPFILLLLLLVLVVVVFLLVLLFFVLFLLLLSSPSPRVYFSFSFPPRNIFFSPFSS